MPDVLLLFSRGFARRVLPIFFFRSLIYFCSRPTRCPAPQRPNGRIRFPWHLGDFVKGPQPKLSFSRNSDFGPPRPSNSFDPHLPNACVCFFLTWGSFQRLSLSVHYVVTSNFQRSVMFAIASNLLHLPAHTGFPGTNPSPFPTSVTHGTEQ